MAKHFIDTEFIEHAGGIQLLSLGIYSENGKTFYGENVDHDPSLADSWVQSNVLPLLWKNGGNIEKSDYFCIGNEKTIGKHVLDYLVRECDNDTDPVFYAYFAAYDWVVFARLFGRLIEKPDHFPMWVVDLKQMMWERGLTKEWKRAQCPDPEGEHNALVDARWNYKLYQEIIKTRNTLTQKVGDMTYTWFPDSEMVKP